MTSKRRRLTDSQVADAQRLAAAIKRDERSQMEIAAACGWKTQGAISQYALGRISLNISALVKICAALKVEPSDISPTLAKEMEMVGLAATSKAKKGLHLRSPGFMPVLTSQQMSLKVFFDSVLSSFTDQQARAIRDMILAMGISAPTEPKKEVTA